MSDGSQDVEKVPEDEQTFRREIEQYYLPQRLIDAIYELGEIPKYSIITQIGIGFIDIADYTYISKFLSPNENQAVLNGLYTALNWVIKRHGGYLNKIEGDSLMFHYGGLTDPNAKLAAQESNVENIARELFYTCVEMQRVVSLFNQAKDSFIYEDVDSTTKEALRQAFEIIGTMRNSMELSASFNALFQIRVRIGANIGEVTLGNFGPDGAKQWDVIGLPVIDAKRMEATAPIGGLRITEHMYKILDGAGIVDAYHGRFRREAQALFSTFSEITKEELFNFGVVTLSDKKNVQFNTYSIQVSPGLPEAIGEQVKLLLDKGEDGADRVLDFVKYYRGNRFVIQALETVFRDTGVNIRKQYILRSVAPKRLEAISNACGGAEDDVAAAVDEKYSLFDLLDVFSVYQDKVNALDKYHEFKPEFKSYEQYMDEQTKILKRVFEVRQKAERQQRYFYAVIFPLVFRSLRTSILEYQSAPGDAEVLLDA